MHVSPFATPLVLINLSFVILISWHVYSTEIQESRLNGVLLVVAFLISTILTPFILKGTGATNAGENFLFSIGSLFFTGILVIILVLVIRNYMICRKQPDLKEERDYEQFLKEIEVMDDGYRDWSRKVLHVVIAVVPLIIHVAVNAVDQFFKENDLFQDLGITGPSAARGINLLVFWGFSYMITLQDLFRFHAFHCIPGWGVRWLKVSLEKKEFKSFIASVPLLMGVVPFMLAPLDAFLAVMLNCSLADAASSIVGRNVGKHHIKLGRKKTWEGVTGGALVSFSVTFIVIFPFHLGIWSRVLGMSVLVACSYAMLDAVNESIDDNYVNTFILGGIIILLHWLIF
ncbi:hypothetical protein GF325_10925 [Candidatus Bathyarchaeota archaeon]|nr:hypothetical protein [Candidatus Bathyarchaeota archaeon]